MRGSASPGPAERPVSTSPRTLLCSPLCFTPRHFLRRDARRGAGCTPEAPRSWPESAESAGFLALPFAGSTPAASTTSAKPSHSGAAEAHFAPWGRTFESRKHAHGPQRAGRARASLHVRAWWQRETTRRRPRGPPPPCRPMTPSTAPPPALESPGRPVARDRAARRHRSPSTTRRPLHRGHKRDCRP